MTPIAQQKQPELASQFSNQSFMPSMAGPSYMQQHSGMHAQQNTAQQANVSQPQFSEAEFEQAFQDAYQHIQASETHQMQADPMEETVISPQDDIAIHEPSQSKIGSDAIEYTDTKERTLDQDTRDANDLARVAGQLVQNVSHETNEKFKNSHFLDLMRRIRDREVEVRNNDFESTQEVQSTSLPQPEQSRPHDPNTFQFPDMDQVYYPDANMDMVGDENFHYNERPQTQISDLHPGGPFYPEQSPPQPGHAHMSGAVDSSLPADDTSNRYATA